MTGLAELWNRLEDGEKEVFFYAAQHVMQERGAELVRAIARHAEDHTRTPCPDPPPVAGPLVCPDCGRVIDGDPVAWLVQVNGANRPLWLDDDCYADRLLHRTPKEGT